MQKFHYELDPDDRRIARRWRLASVGIYGSILLGLILYVAFTARNEVDVASARSVPPASAIGKVQD
jgi:hypothetical protein